MDFQYLMQSLNEELRLINRAIVELERQPAGFSAELRLLRRELFPQRAESAKEERSC